MSSHYSVRSTRGGFITILLALASLFMLWTQFAAYLGGVETHSFAIDGDNTVETEMQINIDITVASPCNALVVNVLDDSNDRLLASEVLKMDDVEFTGPEDDSLELWHYHNKNSNHHDDSEDADDGTDQYTSNKGIFDLLSNNDELEANSLEKRKETLHSVLKHARKSVSTFRKTSKFPKAMRQEMVSALAKPEDYDDIPKFMNDGSLGCRIYGSMPVTKVQGNLHIISKAYFLSAGHLSASQQRVFSSEKTRNELWRQHRNRLPLTHYLFSQANFTHYIDELSFGPYYPSLVNPLDGTKSRWPRRTLRNRLRNFFKQHSESQQGSQKQQNSIQQADSYGKEEQSESLVSGISQDNLKALVQSLKNQASAISAYQYFVSIVPTTYIASTTGRKVKTNQYAVTEQVRDISWQYEFDDDINDTGILKSSETESDDAKDSKDSSKPEETEKSYEEKKLAMLRKALKAMYVLPGRSLSLSHKDEDDHHSRSSATPPGIYLKYDISPIALQITDTRLPFVQFVVRVVNILGGLVVCTMTFYRIVEALLVRLGGKRWKSHDTDLDPSKGILDSKEMVNEIVDTGKNRKDT